MSEHKYININEFRDFGYLQEVNRLFFHPLGLALEIVIDDDGTARLGKVWDSRDDPDGFIFGDGIDEEKKERVNKEMLRRLKHRKKSLGFGFQKEPK